MAAKTSTGSARVTQKQAGATLVGAKALPAPPPRLLAGGNPQISKADGDEAVQRYIAAVPGWKRDVAKRLDALIVRTVGTGGGLRTAVKWNSPFYGIEGKGWFLSFHCFTRYVKVTFFKGASLRPAPAGGTSAEARWIDIHEDNFDEARIAKWVKQAMKIPGWDASAKRYRGDTVSGATKKAGGPREREGIEPGDWRAATLARVREIITGSDAAIVEAVKWRKPSNQMRGIPVWSYAACGIICTGETYKSYVKLTFAQGAALQDPKGLFNASLEGNTRRAIDIREGDKVNATALRALVRAAVRVKAAK